jgi:DNA-directed RNA polymerase specialized sigma24 family protein
VCEAVCPVAHCITMVNEQAFEGNGSQFEAYERDPADYKAWLARTIGNKAITHRSHGFRYRGQYEDELAAEAAAAADGAPPAGAPGD